MTKLSKKEIKLIPAWTKSGLSRPELANRLKVNPATISYHLKKAKNNQRLNNQKSVKTTPKNNHIHKQSIINANGKPFSYSATLLFWGSLIALTLINAFFLWSTNAR